MQNQFFQVVSVEKFRSLLNSFPPLTEKERVSLADACGRVLAGDITAGEHIPPFHRSSMDGYAVAAADTFGASESSPAYLDIMGHVDIERIPEINLESGQCAGVVTGSSLPEGADSVVMQEYCHPVGSAALQITHAVAPGENVLFKGEDCSPGDTAVPGNAVLNSGQIGILAALGIPAVPVYRRPRAGIIVTGDELVPVEDSPHGAQIRDVNSHSISCLIAQSGAQPVIYGIVPDEEEDMAHVLHTACQECDLLLISGGSSVGTRDVTLGAMGRLPDFHLLAHGVSISPGKPTILASSGSLPLIGLPGQITSAQVVTMVLIRPFLEYLQGRRQFPGDDATGRPRAALSRNIASKQGREDYVRTRLKHQDGQLVAEPVLGPGGLLRTLLEADGLIRIPENAEGLQKGETAEILPL